MVLILVVFYSWTPTRGIDFSGFFFTAGPNMSLETVGLAKYKANVRLNHIKTVRDMEALKSFAEKEIREDLHQTRYCTRLILSSFSITLVLERNSLFFLLQCFCFLTLKWLAFAFQRYFS